jgi:hypothetical protein
VEPRARSGLYSLLILLTRMFAQRSFQARLEHSDQPQYQIASGQLARDANGGCFG